MKVLLTTFSAAAHSSFGSQTRELWTRLIATGEFESVIQHGWFHRETMSGITPPWEIFPTNVGYDDQGNPRATMADRYGEQSIKRVMEMVKPEIIWSLADPFMIHHLPQFRDAHSCKLAVWTPIDGVPIPRRYADLFRTADYTAGITEWGAKHMEVLADKAVPHIHHGVDTQLFCPKDPEEIKGLRAEAAQNTDLPEDALLLGFCGKNQFRKMPWIFYPLLFYLNSGHWFKCNYCGHITPGPYDTNRRRPLPLPKDCPHCHNSDLEQGKPMKTRMWMHMYQKQGGIDFRWLEYTWNITGFITYTQGLSSQKGMQPSQMVDLYNLIDLYVTLSGGEGFNIPIIESAACGTPVVYSDYSGQAEIGRMVHGTPVRVAAMINEHHTEMHIDRCIADLGDAIQQVHWMGRDLPEKRVIREKGQAARAAVEASFDWNIITAQWVRALKELHGRKPEQRIMGAIA